MKIRHLISLIVALCTLTLGASQPASAQSLPLANWNQSSCDLEQYIEEFNRRHPPEVLFLEDVSALAAPDTPKEKLKQIDKDDYSAQLAARVARCMVGGITGNLEKTLEAAYQRYFSDREARRAIWLLIQELDASYLSDTQRAQNVMMRDHFWPNFADGAFYGAWAGSFILWRMNRARPSRLLAEPSGIGSGAYKAQLRKAGTLQSHMSRTMRFKEWTKSVGKFTTVATGAGFGIGGPVFWARQNGLIPTRAQSASDEVEATYNRLNWLDLDCRAREMNKTLANKQYSGGLQDPDFKKDMAEVNKVISGLEFMIDVSHLYYVQVDMPADMKWDANSISYRESSIQCPNGFSKPDLTQITSNDVRSSVTALGRTFLNKYSVHLLDPMRAKLNLFMSDRAEIIAKIFNEKASPELKTFFEKAGPAVVRFLGAPIDNVIKTLSQYIGMKYPPKGKEPSPQNLEILEKDKAVLVSYVALLAQMPANVRTEMDKLARELVAALPPTLLNQLVLDTFVQRARSAGGRPLVLENVQADRKTANLVFLFHLGMILKEGFDSEAIVNKDVYLPPQELMFYQYSLAGGAQ